MRGCEVVNGFNILRLPYLEIISPVFKNIVRIDIFSTGLLFYGQIRPQTKKIRKKITLLLIPPPPKFGPQEVNRFSQLCAEFKPPGIFELHATTFSNLVKMVVPSVRILLRVLQRMKACMDEF